MSHPLLSNRYPLLVLICLVAGCTNENTRPTLDYAPENVEQIRKAQGLVPEEESATDPEATEEGDEDGSDDDQ